jgi:hypothetical protein
MQTSNYIPKVPIIYVKEKSTEFIHVVGSEYFDRLYIDENGRLQYCDTETGGGTSNGNYEFVKNIDGYNPISSPIWSTITGSKVYEPYKVEMVDPFDYGLQKLASKLTEAREEAYARLVRR